MAAGYLACEIRNHAIDLIQQTIPHRYVPGKDHGKAEGACWQWNMRVDADGKEALLNALEHRVFEYERDRHEALVGSWVQSGHRGVFVLDTSDPPERNLHLVFADTKALAAVRFRSFVRDYRAIELPPQELEQSPYGLAQILLGIQGQFQ